VPLFQKGDQAPAPATNPITDLLLHNVTRVGAIGGGLYVVSTFVHAAIHKSWDEAASGLGYAGILLMVGGAAFRAKRAADISATGAAEAQEARAAIATAVGAPIVPATSNDRTIQREIDKRQSGTVPDPGV